MNQKNSLGLNECFLDTEDPFELFKNWMEKAKKNEINHPNATSLATSDKDNNPSVRMVLLKAVTKEGFVFYTNLNSEKSLDIKENPKASMCFYWKSLIRQIRIDGSISIIDDSESDKYFNSRDYESKIGAWASDQSKILEKRENLLNKIQEYKKKFSKLDNLPRPKHWSGWCLIPTSIEFWLHGENRIHERLRYDRKNSGWKKVLLNP